jgi:hypothetical protein
MARIRVARIQPGKIQPRKTSSLLRRRFQKGHM